MGKLVKTFTRKRSSRIMKKATMKSTEPSGSSSEGNSKRYKCNESASTSTINKIQEKEDLGPVFNSEREAEMAKCITTLCNLGYGPSISWVTEVTHDYIVANNLEIPQFKNKTPSLSWIKWFMARNNLCHKEAEIVSSIEEPKLEDPFLVYDFYETLVKVFRENPGLDSHRIWSCGEISLPTVPTGKKVIAVKGKRALKLRYDFGTDNMTVFGVCSASGVVMPPVFIFEGQDFLVDWYGYKGLPKTLYAKSDTGRMETDTFAEWFDKFIAEVKERPLLILLDADTCDMSVKIVERARAENIAMVLFPVLNQTDALQPLDATCYGPLKRAWETRLQTRVSELGMTGPVIESEFVNELCAVWKEAMTPENAIDGFKTTGICPLDCEKYPKDRLDPNLMKKYASWKSTGKPMDWKKYFEEKNETETIETSAVAQSSPPQTFTLTTVENYDDLVARIGQYPCPAPAGFQWKPKWELHPIELSTTQTPKP